MFLSGLSLDGIARVCKKSVRDIMEPEFWYAICGCLAVAIVIVPIAIWAVRTRLKGEKRYAQYDEEYYRYIRAKRKLIEKKSSK